MKCWIARDSNGTINLYPEKPVLIERYGGYWISDDWLKLDFDFFPEVTFENSPMEVELKLIEK